MGECLAYEIMKDRPHSTRDECRGHINLAQLTAYLVLQDGVMVSL